MKPPKKPNHQGLEHSTVSQFQRYVPQPRPPKRPSKGKK